MVSPSIEGPTTKKVLRFLSFSDGGLCREASHLPIKVFCMKRKFYIVLSIMLLVCANTGILFSRSHNRAPMFDNVPPEDLERLERRGRQGPAGPPGPPGICGRQGQPGKPGGCGKKGPCGLKGLTGAPGPAGPRGKRGERGEQGDQGHHGYPHPIKVPGRLTIKYTIKNAIWGKAKGKWRLSVVAPDGTVTHDPKGAVSLHILAGHRREFSLPSPLQEGVYTIVISGKHVIISPDTKVAPIGAHGIVIEDSVNQLPTQLAPSLFTNSPSGHINEIRCFYTFAHPKLP